MKPDPHPIPALLVVCAAGVLLFATSNAGFSAEDAGQDQPPDDGRAQLLIFMRAKLESSQSVLEGLVTGNFDKVLAGAEKMEVMSAAAQWYVMPGEEYKRRSEVFRAAAQRLAQMAKAKNSDGAALAYMQLTMSCIDCHQAVRAPGVARLSPNSLRRAAEQPTASSPQIADRGF
ncbi:MAG TPA: hypothetical protein VMN36_17880 [Verrucomicrobiales bacterium]|nr:hypothetical protein [Verrucomicrobiales bacterium]